MPHVTSTIETRRQRTPRGIAAVFVLMAYIFVGFAGEIFCSRETLASVNQIEVGDAPAQSDQEPKKSAAVVDHCYTCAPSLLPEQVLVVERSALTVRRAFGRPLLLFEIAPGLDTPPPRSLI